MEPEKSPCCANGASLMRLQMLVALRFRLNNGAYYPVPLCRHRCSHFLRLRSQMSAAIEPTTPIAAMPEKASISGTGVPT